MRLCEAISTLPPQALIDRELSQAKNVIGLPVTGLLPRQPLIGHNVPDQHVWRKAGLFFLCTYTRSAMEHQISRGASEVVRFDDVTGEVLGPVDYNRRINGSYYRAGDGFLVLYASEGQLYVQVGTTRFLVGAEALTMRYAHDFMEGTTAVKISDGRSAVELRYEAWWSELGLAPKEIMYAPERDADEDSLAHLSEVIDDASWRARVIERWTWSPPGRYCVLVDGIAGRPTPTEMAYFTSKKAAISEAKQLIAGNLEGFLNPSLEADALFDLYVQQGMKPIIERDGSPVDFDALGHARRLCKKMTSGNRVTDESRARVAKVLARIPRKHAKDVAWMRAACRDQGRTEEEIDAHIAGWYEQLSGAEAGGDRPSPAAPSPSKKAKRRQPAAKEHHDARALAQEATTLLVEHFRACGQRSWSGRFEVITQLLLENADEAADKAYRKIPQAGMGGLTDLWLKSTKDQARFLVLEDLVMRSLANLRRYVSKRPKSKPTRIDLSEEAIQRKCEVMVRRLDA